MNVRREGRVTIVQAPRRITATGGARMLRRRLFELLGEGSPRIVLNLEPTIYMDSFGLAELIAIYKRTRELNGAMAVQCPPGRVRDLLHVTRLDDVLEAYADEATAVAAVRGPGEAGDPGAPVARRPVPSA